VGGHCIAVDPWFIIDSAPSEAKLICAARKVNDFMPNYVADKFKKDAALFKNPVITCLGLTYKANTGDLRESPAVKIVYQLAKQNVVRILVVEPFVDALPSTLNDFENVQLTDLKDGLDKADLVLLLVDHHAFTKIDYEMLKTKIVTDTRGLWR